MSTESSYQLLNENETALLRDYLEVFRDLHVACNTVICGVLTNQNFLHLKFQKDVMTIVDLYMAWQALIDNYETMTTENEDLPKGDMARMIMNSLIKRKSCVEPTLNGRLGGVYALQKFISETHTRTSCREMLQAIYLDPEYRSEFNSICDVTELQLAEEVINLLRRFDVCRRMQSEDKAPITKRPKLSWKRASVAPAVPMSAYSAEILQMGNQVV